MTFRQIREAIMTDLPAIMPVTATTREMIQAWVFATALAKQWDATLPYIEQHRLHPWTHNKATQKAIESYRITSVQ